MVAFVLIRVCQRRLPSRTGTARILALALFAGPVGLLYTSSLGGFYEASVSDGALRLEYLSPVWHQSLPLSDLVAVEGKPAFKGRWRLHLRTASGQCYESATSSPFAVDLAEQWLLRMRSEWAAAQPP